MQKALLGLLVVLVILCAGVVAVFSLIGGSDACNLAMDRARASQEAKDRLGEPITKGLFVSGNISTSGPAGRADLSIPVSGPKGKGTLYVVATKSVGEWKLNRLILEESAKLDRVNLLQSQAAQ